MSTPSSNTRSKRKLPADAGTSGTVAERPARRSRVEHTPSRLIGLGPDLLDHVLSCLWPEDLASLARATGTCSALHERLVPVGRLVAERLGLRGGPAFDSARLAKLSMEVITAKQAAEDVQIVLEHPPPMSLFGALPLAQQQKELDLLRARALTTYKQLDALVIVQHSPLLLSLLTDPKANVRTLTLHILRKLPAQWLASRAMGPLVQRLNDDNPWARLATLRAMESIGGAALAPSFAPIVPHLATGGPELDSCAAHLVRVTALDCLSLALRTVEADGATPRAAEIRAAVAEALPRLAEHVDPKVAAFGRTAAARLGIDASAAGYVEYCRVLAARQ